MFPPVAGMALIIVGFDSDGCCTGFAGGLESFDID